MILQSSKVNIWPGRQVILTDNWVREPPRPCQDDRLLTCTLSQDWSAQCTEGGRRAGASVFHTLSSNYSGPVGVRYVQVAASPPLLPRTWPSTFWCYIVPFLQRSNVFFNLDYCNIWKAMVGFLSQFSAHEAGFVCNLENYNNELTGWSF